MTSVRCTCSVGRLANSVREPRSCVCTRRRPACPGTGARGDLRFNHFVEPRLQARNVAEQAHSWLVFSPPQERFGRDRRSTLTAHCRECNVRFTCSRRYPKDRFISTPQGEDGLNYLCAGYKAFFHHVGRPMRLIGGLLARHRSPAQIMQLYASEDARRDRYGPCTSRAAATGSSATAPRRNRDARRRSARVDGDDLPGEASEEPGPVSTRAVHRRGARAVLDVGAEQIVREISLKGWNVDGAHRGLRTRTPHGRRTGLENRQGRQDHSWV